MLAYMAPQLSVLLLCLIMTQPQICWSQTLSDYLDPAAPLIETDGFYYDIEAWAARTTNCVDTPSMACMACAEPLAEYATANGVAPIGISNDFWFNPETAATCGMCLRVYMDTSDNSAILQGTKPYYPTVSEEWAYNASIIYDEQVGMYYFVATVVEWFDRWQSSGQAITYPVFQRDDVNQFGVWRVYLKPVECPVNGFNMTFQFMDYSKPYPLQIKDQTGWTESGPSVGDLPDGVSETLCNNLADEPCGKLTEEDPNRNPIGHIKLKVSQARVPIGDVVLVYNGEEYPMKRTGDGFWSPESSAPNLQLNEAVTVKVQCLDGPNAKFVTTDVVPGECLCMYQDPACIPCESNVQCPSGL